MRRGQRIVETVRKRRLGDHGKLGRRGERRAHERTKTEDERCFRGQRIHSGPALALQQERAKPHAAEVAAQYRLRQRQPR